MGLMYDTEMLNIQNNIAICIGAQIIVQTLKSLGVDTIFGYPGGIVLSIYDELYKQKDIKHYLSRHEQAAIHSAEGYARVSGKCGVALVTSGPGATNIVTGVANAYLDGQPLVVITGQVNTSLLGKDAFQEVNIVEITKTCTKKSFQITNIKDLQAGLTEAFEVALTGKKGPVVVDITRNVLIDKIVYSECSLPYFEQTEVSIDKMNSVLKEICAAKRPVIVAGGGVVSSRASDELLALVRKLQIPVVNTMMGLGTYPNEDVYYAGMVGLFGDYSANQALKESDLIFSIGARFNDRITCCFKEKELERHFIQLDINSAEIARHVNPKTVLLGDAKQILANMVGLNADYNHLVRNEWLREIEEYKALNSQKIKITDKLNTYSVIKKVSDYIENANPIVTTEVGQHQIWTAKAFNFKHPSQFVTSGGLGTMGFGLPAAIGAAVADKSRPVICFAGDGSIQMNIQELALLKDYDLPIKIFILNNGYLGMVRQFQEKSFEGRYSETAISGPDYVALAKAYGIDACRVKTDNDLDESIKWSFTQKGPVIVDVITEPFELL